VYGNIYVLSTHSKDIVFSCIDVASLIVKELNLFLDEYPDKKNLISNSTILYQDQNTNELKICILYLFCITINSSFVTKISI